MPSLQACADFCVMITQISSESSFWVLNFKDFKVEVLAVKFFEACSVNLVLKLGDSKVFDLNWVSHCPFKTNWYGWNVIDMFDQLKLSSSVEGLTFKSNSNWLTIGDLEDSVEIVLLDFFRIVHNTEVHLFTRGE